MRVIYSVAAAKGLLEIEVNGSITLSNGRIHQLKTIHPVQPEVIGDQLECVRYGLEADTAVE